MVARLAEQDWQQVNALPALATGKFFERPVRPFLRSTFTCVWVHQMPESGALPIIVMPDATIDLQWIEGGFRIAGPDKDPKIEALPAGATVIGFRFRPAVAAAWLEVPAREILGERLSLGRLWGGSATRLAGKIRACPDLAELIVRLEEALAGYAPKRSADRPMQAAYDLVRAGARPAAPLVPWLGRVLGMSERTLRRRFDECFGYGPKTLDRILRYQRFLQMARATNEPTAILAVEAGYTDQAHLIAESRRLTGSTPKRLPRMMPARGEGLPLTLSP
jgi:AraC-like DNA-binding protein